MKAQRVRISFSKTEAMRYTGHLDLILTWERTFRRAGLPLSYSEGFNPRPVINLASPLPLGFTSIAEIGDFWLSTSVPIDKLQHALSAALPPGLEINGVVDVAEIFGDKLPALVTASAYSVELENTHPDLPSKVTDLLNQSQHIRIKKGKEYDLRPLILDIELVENENLLIRLVTKPDRTGRPDEVLEALGLSRYQARIERIAITLRPGGVD